MVTCLREDNYALFWPFKNLYSFLQRSIALISQNSYKKKILFVNLMRKIQCTALHKTKIYVNYLLLMFLRNFKQQRFQIILVFSRPKQWRMGGGSYAYHLVTKKINVIFSHYACNGSKQITCFAVIELI